MHYFSDDKNVTLTCDFPFAKIDADLGLTDELDAKKPEKVDWGAAADILEKLLLWIYRPGASFNRDGATDRLVISVWMFCRIMHRRSMTDMAAEWGKKKQSLGRALKDFKKKYPGTPKALKHLRVK